MPDVELQMDIHAPVARVWDTVVDIESYPALMESVRSVRIVDFAGPTERTVAWSVTLKGSILEWREVERLDPARHVVRFEQLSGDMERFEGAWRLTARAPHLTRVRLAVSFEIGIPLLAEMLNPVAQRSLHDNCREMLLGIEQEALAA
jgi:ribosome-associated toxin RatA of RatAB toxin-antitoxin module